MEKEQFWMDEMHQANSYGAAYEIRAIKAWELMLRYGLIAAETTGEDSAGRARLDVMEPQKVVERCFALADAFMDMAIARGEIRRATLTDKDRAAHKAELEKFAADLRRKRLEETTGTPEKV